MPLDSAASGRRSAGVPGRRPLVVRVVILDVDGTLVDTNYLHVEAWARAFRALGHCVPRAAIHRQIGKGSDQLIPEFVSDAAAARRADELHGEYYAELEPHAYPLPGARELLARLAARGLGLWLATSAKPDELERHLETLAARDKLAGVVSSKDVERSKPAGDIFQATLQRAGCDADEAIVVGDTVWDVLAAREAGLRTVALLSGGAFSQAELEAAGAVAVDADCAALLAASFPDGL
jgi:HAD superfamily hydrolase (TIGR01509 family)